MQNLLISILSFGGLLCLMGTSHAGEYHYGCVDNTRLSVTFSGEGTAPGTAHLAIAGTPVNVTLPQVPSADGGRYADGGLEFWINGRSARLTRPGTETTTCTAK
jgi:membrane-bound inhibitor of C-type lysozyme